MCKNPARNTLRGCLSNDFQLLRRPHCIMFNLLIAYVLQFDTPHDSVCKFWQRFSSNVFFYFSALNVIIFGTFITSMSRTVNGAPANQIKFLKNA